MNSRFEEARQALGVSSKTFYIKRNKPDNINKYVPPEPPSRLNISTPLKKQAVDMFCHSDEALSIDSNAVNSFVIVNNERHVK